MKDKPIGESGGVHDSDPFLARLFAFYDADRM